MTGIELIAIERQEQIEKHGFNIRNDQYYSGCELSMAAKFCITLDDDNWPINWDNHFKNKILNKSYKERMIVSGAFLAAEIDRLNILEVKP